VPDGRERGGIHRRGWLRPHSPAQPVEAAQPADDAGDTRPDDGAGTADGPEPATSLDEVLRRAAQARDTERDPGH